MIIQRQRWAAVAIFFFFMLLHQTDRLLIGSLTTPIMKEFNLSEVQMGGIITGSLILGSIFYPIWGFLYDRFARPKLLALASFLWGLTTWFSALAPTARLFLISRASTGIDDSSYPGIGTLISDYFPPKQRARLFGFLQISIPLGYLLGLMLALKISPTYGWRTIYFLTGSVGFVLAFLIFFGVKDIPRGSSEPELSPIGDFETAKVQWGDVPGLLKIRSLRYLFIQGFIGVLPWQVITFWFFRYLEIERNYNPETISSIMVPAVLMIGAGYFFGGLIGDMAYKKYKSGRLFVSVAGILLGAVFITIALSISVKNIFTFRILLSIASFFIPLASPNIATSVYDIVLPEVRSTATSIQYFLGNLGSAFAPLLAGAISEISSLGTAILTISLSAWLITALILGICIFFFENDMEKMHTELENRASALLNQ